MKVIRTSSEDEMILEFLKGEFISKRFNEKLQDVIDKLNINQDIIINGNVKSVEENQLRKKIMKMFRGYPDEELFEMFPKNIEWKFVQFDDNDIDKIYYINYDYWNELSNNTSKPIEAAKNIRGGIEIYNVSNQPFIDGEKLLEFKKFSPIIILTSNEEKYLIIEGHSRMTIYGLNPNKFVNTYGFVGHCSEKEMQYYDLRMISDANKLQAKGSDKNE